VSFPKFRLEQSFDLGNALKALGMKDMFDPVKANFTNFAEPGKGVEDNLYVSAVLHKAFLEVSSYLRPLRLEITR
jgi:serine protease inhibitor